LTVAQHESQRRAQRIGDGGLDQRELRSQQRFLHLVRHADRQRAAFERVDGRARQRPAERLRLFLDAKPDLIPERTDLLQRRRGRFGGARRDGLRFRLRLCYGLGLRLRHGLRFRLRPRRRDRDGRRAALVERDARRERLEARILALYDQP
jgi:hypothetical protein